MTQYCRYCAHLMTGNGIWCEANEKEMTESQAKHTNKCREFDFVSMDAFDPDREYHPQPKRAKPLEYFGTITWNGVVYQ